MTMLETMRDAVKANIAKAQATIDAANAEIVGHNELLAQVEAEIGRSPMLDDVRALLDRMAAASAKTA